MKIMLIILAVILYIVSIYFFNKFKKVRNIKKNSIEVMGTITDAIILKQFFVLEYDHSRGWHREWYTEYKLKVEYEIKGEKRETYIERAQNSILKSPVGEKEILYINDDLNSIIKVETTSMYFGIGAFCVMIATALVVLLYILPDIFLT